MGLGFIVFFGGLVISLGLYFWVRQRQALGFIPTVDARQTDPEFPMASGDDAVLVSRDTGQLLYMNERAHHWLGMNGGEPSLEVVAAMAQPADNFLGLFVRQGQASFQFGNRWVEASSHTIPSGPETRTVIVMREIAAHHQAASSLDLSLALQVINEIGETINASMSLQQVYQALLTMIMRAIPSSAGEICLWDETSRRLSPQGWAGDAPYVIKLSEYGGVYRYGEGISGYIAQHRRAVLVASIFDGSSVQPKLSGFYKSFVGVPLLLGDRFMGTLELAHKQPNSYNPAHLAFLQAISTQVATSIYNTQLYADQSQRINDMASIGELLRSGKTDTEVRSVYKTLNEQVAKVLSLGVSGVLLYDETRRALVPQLPFHGVPDNLAQNIIIPLPNDTPQRDIFEHQDYWISNDVIEEELLEVLGLQSILSVAGIKNTALLPLQIGDQRIGMMQLCNRKGASGFSSQDIREMKLVVAQAAVVIENLRLFQREQRRDTELAGLQEITHAIGSLNREDEFYSTINERIARQMSVTLCGILLYDPARRALVSQLPFYGLGDDKIKDYSISLSADSPLLALWEDYEFWYTNQVQTSSVVHAAGLAEFAEQLGVQKTLFAALMVGGRRLGVIQASNPINDVDFTDKDAQLLLIFASQVAAMIENARLYRNVMQSAEQSSSLRRIAELAGEVIKPEDPFKPVLAEIAVLTSSPLVFINALDRQAGTLTTYPRWVYGMEMAEAVVFDIFSDGVEHSTALSEEPFFSNDLQSDKRVLLAYQDVANRFSLNRVVMVPLIVGERVLGELGIANRDKAYTQEDVLLLSAIAAQISATIERLRLYEAAGENLNRRILELDAISRISNELATTLELDVILDVISQEATRATQADGATLVLLKHSSLWHVPNQPEMSKRLGDLSGLTELAPIEMASFERGANYVLVEDYAKSEYAPRPEQARSALAVAFFYEDQIVGILHLYHARPYNFDERAGAFLLTLAAKASLGYGNFRRFQDQVSRSDRLNRRVEQLNRIFELGRELQGNIDQVELLEAILESLQEGVGYDFGVAALTDETDGLVRRVAQLGMPLDAFERSKDDTLPLGSLQQLFADRSFRISESYFLPVEQRTRWLSPELENIQINFPGKRTWTPIEHEHAWLDGDLLLLPLNAPDGRLLGVISLDGPRDGMRPDRQRMEVLEIFAHQAESNIENIRLYLASLQSAEQEARLNDIMEAFSSSLDVGQMIESMAAGMLRLIPYSLLTIALQDPEDGTVDVFRATLKADSSVTVLREYSAALDHSALAQVLKTGQDMVLLAGDPECNPYNDILAAHMQGVQASLLVALSAGGSPIGVLYLGALTNKEGDLNEFIPLLKRVANVATVSIQNARLFNEALNLRNFNESVVESIQQGIVVLDRAGKIISINDFMEQRYGWKLEEAMRLPLFQYRPDLAEMIQGDIETVLETGIQQEKIGQATRLSSGKLLVRNFYTYPLKSGDSVRGAVLLVEDVTDRALLEKDLETRANQLSALTEVSSRITASLNREEVINLALDEISQVIDFDTMTLWTRRGEVLVLEGSSGTFGEIAMLADEDAVIVIREHERMHQLIEQKVPFSISNLLGLDSVPGDSQYGSWLGVPLIYQDDVIGVIALSKQETGYYDVQGEQAALAFANQVAVAMENASLYSEAQHQTERLGLLNRVSVSLAQSLDSENILEIALSEIASAMSVDHARAMIFERGLMIGRVVMEYPRGDVPPDELINLLNNPLYQELRRNAAPIIINDVVQLPETDPMREELHRRNLSAFVMVPMTVAGQVIGAFDMEIFSGARYFTPEQIDLSLIIANQAAIAVQNTNLLEQTLVRTRELETLLEAAQATSLTLNLEDAFRSVVDLMLHALEMDDCAVMMWDNIENALEVRMDVSRYGEPDQVAPSGTVYNLRQFTTKGRALENAEVIIVRRDEDIGDPAEIEDLAKTGAGLRVLIPLVVRDQAIGLIQAQRNQVMREFSHREVRLAQALGAQSAIAIQNARLSTETAALVEEAFLINNLSQSISATLNMNDMIEIIREQVPRVTSAEEMYLALYEPETAEISFPLVIRGGVEQVIPPRLLNNDEVSFIIQHRRSLSLGGGNWSSDEMRTNLGIANGEADAKSYLGVPIAAGDQVLGVLALRDTQNTRAFGINDERLLTTVGTQLGAAIQNARLFNQVSTFADELNRRVQQRTEELQRERDNLDTLYRITSELAKTLDMDRVLGRALEMVAAAVMADDGVIMLIDPLSDRLMPRSMLGSLYVPNEMLDTQHPAEMLATWLLQNGQQTVVTDLHNEAYWDLNVPDASEWHGALAVVLESNDDPQGVMVLLSRKQRAFSEAQLKLVIAAANQVAAAINNADLYQLIRDQAERLGTLVRVEQEESEKNSAIVEGIADGVMLADQEGTIVLFNDAAQRILELQRDQVIGQAMFRLTGLFGGSAAKWAQAIEDWTRHPEQHKAGDFLIETLDLEDKIVRVSLSPVYISERFLGTVSLFRDITKDVEVERIKKEFVDNVTHELRTPLTSIKGFVDLLLMGVAGKLGDPQLNFLQKIKSNTDRMTKLVEDLLNISQLDQGMNLNLEPVDLSDMVPRIVRQIERRSDNEKKEMQVQVTLDPNLPLIEADESKLTQVLSNIIDNAFNYTYPGGSIEVAARPEGERVLVSVKDSGIGIPDEFKTRIWGRFERNDEHALVMDVAGTGLGLAIVKELVLMHNGEIWFDSEQGKGTTFFVSLPVSQPLANRAE